jgi:hypothetical protein
MGMKSARMWMWAAALAAALGVEDAFATGGAVVAADGD